MPKNKKEWIRAIILTLIVILGTFVVAFGNVCFLVPMEINAGGLSGIALIFRHFIKDPQMKTIVYNIIITSLSILFWLLGLIFIGKEFAIKTLVATISFPAANWLFTMCPGISNVTTTIGESLRTAGTGPTAGNFLLGGIFGGVFVGAGVAITFVGGGSTGGVDVFVFLFEKYLRIKSSIAAFIVDGSIVAAGILILVPQDSNAYLLPCLSGIISAFMSSILIEVIYTGSQTSYQADIISDKWKDISEYALVELDRGTTIIRAEGGYKGGERIILRIVFDKRQYNKIREFIAKTDPHAFVTYTRTNAVFGEGFRSHTIKKINEKNNDNGK